MVGKILVVVLSVFELAFTGPGSAEGGDGVWAAVATSGRVR